MWHSFLSYMLKTTFKNRQNNIAKITLFDDMCRMGRRTFWSSFDVNQSTV